MRKVKLLTEAYINGAEDPLPKGAEVEVSDATYSALMALKAAVDVPVVSQQNASQGQQVKK